MFTIIKKYERDIRGIEFLEENNIPCKQIEIQTETWYQKDSGCACCH